MAYVSQREPISQNNASDLLDLVWLGLSTPWLQVQNLVNARLTEDMMVTANSPDESEAFEQRA
jgi:hypothetical protein